MTMNTIDLAIAQFEVKCHAIVHELKDVASKYDGTELVNAINKIGEKYGMEV